MTLPSFTGPQRPVFNAPGGLAVQVPAGELRTQIQTLSQQPGMGYLSDLSQRSDVNWQPVKLAFDQWSYKQEGLTPAGAALLSVAVAWATGGMGAGVLGTSSATTSAMANAAFMSLSSQAAITLVNNKGNIGKTLSDLAKSDTVKATVAAALTAGVLDKIGALEGMQSLKNTDKLTYNLINAGGRALTNTAINGGNLEDALKQALVGGLVDTAHGEVASQIKVLEGEYLTHKLAHALAGCVAGAAAGGECRDGAIGAAAGEVVAEMLAGQKPGQGATKEQLIAFDQKVVAYSKLVAGAVSAYAGGNAQTAITTAEVAVQNNYLSKPQLTALQNELNACKQNNCTEAQTNAVLDKYVKLSASNDAALAACTTTACVEQHRKTIAEASALSLEVKHQVGNLLASERLIGELQGREKLSTGGTVQQLYARAERIEQARKQLDQYVQAQCQGLSSAACTTKLQSSQATAGVVTQGDCISPQP
jgi:filamentous hemagglutinin